MCPLHIVLISGQAVPEPSGSLSGICGCPPPCSAAESVGTAVLPLSLIFTQSSSSLPKRARRREETSSAAGLRREACMPLQPMQGPLCWLSTWLCDGCGFSFSTDSRCCWHCVLRALSPPRTSAAALSPVRCGEFTSPGAVLVLGVPSSPVSLSRSLTLTSWAHLPSKLPASKSLFQALL